MYGDLCVINLPKECVQWWPTILVLKSWRKKEMLPRRFTLSYFRLMSVILASLFWKYLPVGTSAEQRHVREGVRQVDLPVYSVLDVTDEVVDPFSQSFSPFLLLERLGDRKPSAESGLKHPRHTHIVAVSSPALHVCRSPVFRRCRQRWAVTHFGHQKRGCCWTLY